MVNVALLKRIMNDYYEIIKVPMYIVTMKGVVIAYADQHINLNVVSENMSEVYLSINNNLVAKIKFNQLAEGKSSFEQVEDYINSIVILMNGMIQKHNVHLELVRDNKKYTKDISQMKEKIVTKKHDDTVYIRKKQIMHTVAAMGYMIEKRDLYTAKHQKKVAYLAGKIAIEMGLPPESVEDIYIAGLLHDIGKIAIPSEILTKPDKLSEVEFEIIKSHVRVAYDILDKVQFTRPIAQIVLQHHEKINGTGYPNGLEGDKILLEAKIICVADVVEAITSHRPYRSALGLPYALREITKYSGVYYEPEVVNACIHVCSKDNWNEMIEEAFTDSINY